MMVKQSFAFLKPVITFNSATGTSRNGNFSKLDGYFVKNLMRIAAPESVGVATGIAQVFLISAISSAFNAILFYVQFFGFRLTKISSKFQVLISIMSEIKKKRRNV